MLTVLVLFCILNYILSERIGIVCLGQLLYSNKSISRPFECRIEKTVKEISYGGGVLLRLINSLFRRRRKDIFLILSGGDVAQVGISEARYMKQLFENRFLGRTTYD